MDRTFPEDAKAKWDAVQKEPAKEREETSRAVGANLKARVAQRTERTERCLAQDFEPVRGWNVPLDV